jgi:hypothetical protein
VWETSVALPSEESSVKVLWDELQEQIKKGSEYIQKRFYKSIEPPVAENTSPSASLALRTSATKVQQINGVRPKT